MKTIPVLMILLPALALAQSAALVRRPLSDDKQCVTLLSNPPQERCTWTECTDATPPVCRRVTETRSRSCSCTAGVTRTECDATGKNCTTWEQNERTFP